MLKQKMYVKVLTALVLGHFTVWQVASAGILVEPYLGYLITGSDTVEETAGVLSGLPFTTKSTLENTGKAPILGARLGMSFLGLQVALDYSMASYTQDTDEVRTLDVPLASAFNSVTKSTTKADIDMTNLAIFIGFQAPLLVRGWVTYSVGGAFEVTSGDFKGREYTGPTIGLGVGFTGLPFIHINLEYKMTTFDEYELNGKTVKLTGDKEVKGKSIILSVSAPFTF